MILGSAQGQLYVYLFPKQINKHYIFMVAERELS